MNSILRNVYAQRGSATPGDVFTVRLRARKPTRGTERDAGRAKDEGSLNEKIGQVPSSFVKYDQGSFLFYAATFFRTFLDRYPAHSRLRAAAFLSN